MSPRNEGDSAAGSSAHPSWSAASAAAFPISNPQRCQPGEAGHESGRAPGLGDRSPSVRPCPCPAGLRKPRGVARRGLRSRALRVTCWHLPGLTQASLRVCTSSNHTAKYRGDGRGGGEPAPAVSGHRAQWPVCAEGALPAAVVIPASFQLCVPGRAARGRSPLQGTQGTRPPPGSPHGHPFSRRFPCR